MTNILVVDDAAADRELAGHLLAGVCSGSRCNMNLTRRSHGATTWPAPDAG